MTRRAGGAAFASLIGVAALTSLTAVEASAATSSASFAVTVTVSATCTIAATSLSFTAYTGQLDANTSVVTITCTNSTPYNVGLSAGSGPSATVTTRAMQNGSLTTPYALYRDAAMTLNWGTTIGTDEVAGTGNGAAQPLTVYGRVAAGLYPTPGAYTDAITATVNF